MTKMRAIVRGDVKANRLLKVSVRQEGLPILRYADDGYPHFRSSKDLSDGQEATISISGDFVWKVESGEDLKAGEAVYAGEGGKLYARRVNDKTPAQLCGYVTEDGKEGDVVTLVRNMQMNGNWIMEVTNSLGELDDE